MPNLTAVGNTGWSTVKTSGILASPERSHLYHLYFQCVQSKPEKDTWDLATLPSGSLPAPSLYQKHSGIPGQDESSLDMWSFPRSGACESKQASDCCEQQKSSFNKDLPNAIVQSSLWEQLVKEFEAYHVFEKLWKTEEIRRSDVLNALSSNPLQTWQVWQPLCWPILKALACHNKAWLHCFKI